MTALLISAVLVVQCSNNFEWKVQTESGLIFCSLICFSSAKHKLPGGSAVCLMPLSIVIVQVAPFLIGGALSCTVQRGNMYGQREGVTIYR